MISMKNVLFDDRLMIISIFMVILYMVEYATIWTNKQDIHYDNIKPSMNQYTVCP